MFKWGNMPKRVMGRIIALFMRNFSLHLKSFTCGTYFKSNNRRDYGNLLGMVISCEHYGSYTLHH